MDSGSQENNQLFMAIRLDSFTNGFDKHNGYHSLASTCLQHCYGVPLLRNFKHLQVVPTQPKKIHIHIHTLLKSRNTNWSSSSTFKKQKKKEAETNPLGFMHLVLEEEGDSWTERSWWDSLISLELRFTGRIFWVWFCCSKQSMLKVVSLDWEKAFDYLNSAK